MDLQALLSPDAAAPLGESRAKVLDLLRSADGPLGVHDISSETGLHLNTARFHLEALVEAGLATREPQPRDTPGRPAMAYRVAAGELPSGQRRYRLLAEMLTSLIAGVMTKPAEAAAEAGREWGRYLTEQPPPYQRLDAQRSIEKLATTLDEVGFAPEVTAQGADYELRLRQCPFREVAERHQDVVCSLHLGLMQGILGQLRAPVSAEHLQPFAEPSVCVAALSARQAARDEQPRQPGTRRRR